MRNKTSRRQKRRTMLGILASAITTRNLELSHEKFMRSHQDKELTKAYTELDRIKQFRVRTALNQDQFLELTMMVHKRDVSLCSCPESMVNDIFGSMKAQFIAKILSEAEGAT